MRQLFPRHWSTFKVIEALDAFKMDEAALRHTFPCPSRELPLSLGELCCAISHLKVLESFLASGSARGVILEDDVEGDDAGLDDALGIVSQLPEDMIVVLGGQQGLRNRSHVYGRSVLGGGAFRIPEPCREFVSRACCYGVSRKGAQVLVQRQRHALDRADHWARLTAGWQQFYLADCLSHPLDLSASHLEADRQAGAAGGVIAAMRRDGPVLLAKRALTKGVFRMFGSLKGYVPVVGQW
jgi:glycosyl transferase, family 25